MRGKPIDIIIGGRYGRLEVISRVEGNKGHGVQWNCHCSCGNDTVAYSSQLVRKAKTSCGCYHRDKTSETFRTHGQTGTVEYKMFKSAKRRAKEQGMPFDLALGDIVVPVVCPVFGIPLRNGTLESHQDSPSLDKIDPLKGYVKDNIWVISHRANLIKNNSSLPELKMLVSALEKRLNKGAAVLSAE